MKIKVYAWAFCLLALFQSCKTSPFAKGKYLITDDFDISLPYDNELRLMIVKVEIEGEEYRFLFDTGAPMVVSKELSEKLNMKVVKNGQVNDSKGQSQRLDFVKMPLLTLRDSSNQELSFKNLVAVEADFSVSTGIYCLNIDGILGANLMRHVYWQISPHVQEIRLTNTWSLIKPKEPVAVIPFKAKSSGTPIVDLVLDSTSYKSITFDTGSNGFLSLPRPKTEGRSFEQGLASWGYHSSGLFGSKIDTFTNIYGTLNLAGYTIDSLQLKLGEEDAKKLLGMGIIENYNTCINWEERQVYFSALDEKVSFQEELYPMSPFYKDGVLIVGRYFPSYFTENAPAIGDTILKIDELETYPLNKDKACEVYQLFRGGDSRKIQVKGKGLYTVKARGL